METVLQGNDDVTDVVEHVIFSPFVPEMAKKLIMVVAHFAAVIAAQSAKGCTVFNPFISILRDSKCLKVCAYSLYTTLH